MLLAADQEIVQRDRTIQGFATALDPQAVTALLASRAPQARLTDARITYLRYKPGIVCLVGYSVTIDGRETPVHLRAYGVNASVKLAKAMKRTGVRGPLGAGRFAVQDIGLVVSVFPTDGMLKALPTLADEVQRERLLSPWLPAHAASAAHHELRTLRYKPERRYVGAAWSAQGGELLLKSYTREDYPAARTAAKALASEGALRLPQRLGRSDRYRLLAFEWLPGLELESWLSGGTVDAGALEATGQALAALHGQTSRRLLERGRKADAAAVEHAANGVIAVCPELEMLTRDLARRLRNALFARSHGLRVIHGDFHTRQVLVQRNGVAIIDLDQFAVGDPAADIGSFAAQLERDVVLGWKAPACAAAIMESFLAGYISGNRRPSDVDLTLQSAAALFRLAPEPFRLRHPEWPRCCAEILERVAALLPGVESQVAPAAAGLARAVRVHDGPGAGADKAMPAIRAALDPVLMQPRLHQCLAGLGAKPGGLRCVRVLRHKPGRRCLIVYEIEDDGLPVQLIGKLRAKGLDFRTYQLHAFLRERGFDTGEVRVPEPVGAFEDLHMWVQRKVEGEPATALLEGGEAAQVAERIALALNRLHVAGPLPERRHTVAKELDILQSRLTILADAKPRWARRLDRLSAACGRLARKLPTGRVCGIHRDFYPDQVLVAHDCVQLVDLDLYCAGDPALDAGNFLAHLTEQGLRKLDDPEALIEPQMAFLERFLGVAGLEARAAVDAYATLSLARLVQISTVIAERRPYTEALLEWCEERLLNRSGRTMGSESRPRLRLP